MSADENTSEGQGSSSNPSTQQAEQGPQPPLPPNPYTGNARLAEIVERGQKPTITREQRASKRKS